MIEVVKEVARRCQKDIDLYWPTNAGGRRSWKVGQCKVTVSFDGWGIPSTFEMAGESYRQELNRVAQAVGAKFTIKNLQFCGFWNSALQEEILRMILAQVEEQGEEGLSKVEFDIAHHSFNKEILSLVEASKEWSMQCLPSWLEQDGTSE